MIVEGLHALLSGADQALGRLDGAIQTLPDPDFFVLMYVRKEAVFSSRIEGTRSSLDDLLGAEGDEPDPDRPEDVKEVQNYVAAMRLGLERLKELPVSVRLLREIHARLMEGVRGKDRAPGELRRVQNWIGPAGATLTEATFVPPPPQLVPDALADLERFLHADDSLPDLLKIGFAHAQFEAIHPFLDGNGRLGRLLITFLLCEREILREPVLYLSHYLNGHRSEYYDRLQAVHDNRDWEGWLKFFLEGVERVAGDATEVSRHVVGLRERHRALIVESFGRTAANALKIHEHLFRRPLIDVKEAQGLSGVSFQAANQLIGRFEEHGILVEFTGQIRNRRFRYAEYIDLFGGRE